MLAESGIDVYMVAAAPPSLLLTLGMQPYAGALDTDDARRWPPPRGDDGGDLLNAAAPPPAGTAEYGMCSL